MSGKGFWLTLRTDKSLSELVAALREEGLFPEDETWWFAWNGLEIKLPGILRDFSELDKHWDVVRVFSLKAELRLARRGRSRGCWLLTEQTPPEGIPGVEIASVEKYPVEEGHRILWGQKLRLPDGEARGEVVFPRKLNYELDNDDLNKAWVADVKLYYDNAHRLQAVRYARLYQVVPGKTEELKAQPFPRPEKALGLEEAKNALQ